MLEECAECKWKYPTSLLSNVFSSERGYSLPTCAICALEIINKGTGANRTEFDGPIAEHMRLMAIKWRKANPDKAPKVN